MVDTTVKEIVLKYIDELKKTGLPVHSAVVFGSYIYGKPDNYSDIDVLVISTCFDNHIDRADIGILWKIAARVDSRIEPQPCGIIQWIEDDISAIIETARREGLIIPAA